MLKNTHGSMYPYNHMIIDYMRANIHSSTATPPSMSAEEERWVYLLQAVLQLSAGKLMGDGGGGAGGAYSFSWKVYGVLLLDLLALTVSR